MRRVQAVQVITPITPITQDDLVIILVRETNPAEARWAVPVWFVTLSITCNLLRLQAPDVVLLVQTERVTTNQESLCLLFRFFTYLATARASST
uniref:Uncharacterized protein n=1 Tax=Arundo donax TaxID=35708 RepID=A0A0A9H388_ARUDO